MSNLSESGLTELGRGRRVLKSDGKAAGNCTFDTPSPGILLLAKDSEQLESPRAFLFDPLGSARSVLAQGWHRSAPVIVHDDSPDCCRVMAVSASPQRTICVLLPLKKNAANYSCSG